MFCTPCLAVFPTHFSQLDLNPANFESTVKAEWILAFLFLQKRHFFNDVTITSSLRSVMQVLMEHFTIFQSHGLLEWFMPKIVKSCLNLSKLRPKYYRSFFPDTVYNDFCILRLLSCACHRQIGIHDCCDISIGLPQEWALNHVYTNDLSPVIQFHRCLHYPSVSTLHSFRRALKSHLFTASSTILVILSAFWPNV